MQEDTYRCAASILLLRVPADDAPIGQLEILLLHKPRKKDAWQLPQGGMECDESIEECAKRELMEEAGIKDLIVLGVSETVYRYDFPASYRRFRPDHICGQCINFVFGITPYDTVVQPDNVEVDDYKWVTPKELPTYLKRKEYLALVKAVLAEAESALLERAE